MPGWWVGSVEGRGEEGPDVSTVPPGLALPSQGKELGLGMKELARGVQAAGRHEIRGVGRVFGCSVGSGMRRQRGKQ